MPLYAFKCTACHQEFDAISTIEGSTAVRCTICSGPTTVLITGTNYHAFPSGWWRDIAPDPIHISSRQQLKEECEKHDCYAKYLDPPIAFRKT